MNSPFGMRDLPSPSSPADPLLRHCLPTGLKGATLGDPLSMGGPLACLPGIFLFLALYAPPIQTPASQDVGVRHRWPGDGQSLHSGQPLLLTLRVDHQKLSGPMGSPLASLQFVEEADHGQFDQREENEAHAAELKQTIPEIRSNAFTIQMSSAFT